MDVKPMTPSTRFTAEQLTQMADAMEMRRVKVGDRLLTEVQAVRQGAADAKRVEKEQEFRAWLVKRMDDRPTYDEKYHALEDALAELDRLLAERGGEEG